MYGPTVDFAGLFAGIGVMILSCVMAYFFYQLTRVFRSSADKEEKYDLFHEMMLDKYASKKGIDLNKELVKRNVFKQQRKSIRRKVEEEIYDEMFGKGKKEDK